VTLLDTGPFATSPAEFGWVEHLLDRYILSKEHRGDGIYAVGRKTGPVRERYPEWLYELGHANALAQPPADAVHGAARHSGALPRLVRGRGVGRF